MKNKLLSACLLLACLVSPAIAADPVVVVTNVSSVTVDGVPSGSVVDVLANVNKPNIRARLLDALVARETALIAAAAATEKARADTAIAAANAAKVAAEQSQAAAVAARNVAESAKAAESARVAAIVAALKGVAPTLLPANVRAELLSAKEKERAALLAAKADAEAKLAALP